MKDGKDTYFFSDCFQHGSSQFDPNAASRTMARFRKISRQIRPEVSPPFLDRQGAWRGTDLGFLMAELAHQHTGLVIGGNAAKRIPGKKNGTSFSLATVGGNLILSTVGKNTYPVMARLLGLDSIEVALLDIGNAAQKMNVQNKERMTTTQYRSLWFQTAALAQLAHLETLPTHPNSIFGGEVKTIKPDSGMRIVYIDSFGNLKLSGRRKDLPKGERIKVSFPEKAHRNLSPLGANNTAHITGGRENEFQVSVGSSIPTEAGGLLELQILGGTRIGVDTAADKVLGHFLGVPDVRCHHDLIGIKVRLSKAS